ncbi:MAG: carbohydrate ABC transporter permease [Oscillospiraceae bacterium]|jgi:multiple sugar transport system permease protein|nr:carbohydrate ABC transporter permease [Oscillospiraceae bacterium]
MKRSAGARIRGACLTLACGIIMVVVVFPVLYMLLGSLMSPAEINEYYSDGIRFHMLPAILSLDGYYRILLQTPDYLQKFWNSMLLSGAVVFLQFAVSCLAGFAFAKYEFKLKRALFFSLIVLMLLPLQAIIVPNYILFDKLKLLDTWWPLIVSGAFTPFGAVLMTQVFKTVPNEIIEAARIDGAGAVRILCQIVMPVAKGGLISLVILTFIDAWNMVEQPVAFLREASQYPLSVFLAYFNRQNLTLSFACGMLSLLPGLLLFLHYRDELSEGIDFRL